MKAYGRLCGLIAVLVVLAAPPALAASDSQLRWSELGAAVSGKTVTIHLPDRAEIKGKVLSVHSDGLLVQVVKTSDPSGHPEGRVVIPRKSVSVLELEKKNVVRRVLIGVGTGVGTALIVTALMATQAVARSDLSKDEDAKETERKIKAAALVIGALSVAVGVKFGIDAARDRRGKTVKVITVIPEQE